jgi:lysophospholipase L1-like esterase
MRFRLLQLLLCACVFIFFAALLEFAERSSAYFALTFYPDAGIVRYRAGDTLRWGREGYGVTRVGARGMIAAKPLDKGKRVLFLGDSYTEALQVDDADKFTEILQSLYNQQFPQTPITTLNFAVSGQGAAQHAADLPGLLQTQKPQLVVAQLSVYDFWPADAKRKIPAQPAYLAEKNGALALERKPYAPPAGWREKLMRIRLFSFYARASWRLQNLFKPQTEDENAPAPETAAKVQTDAYFTEYKRITRFLLTQMAQQTRASGAQMAALYTPKTPLLQDGRVLWDEAEFGEQYLKEREILIETCRELGLPLWNPAEKLNRYAAATGRFPNGFANTRPGYGHLNPEGHRLVAELLAAELPALLRED